jgi:hypothetical protein
LGRSAAVQDNVFPKVGTIVVHDFAFQFNPGMTVERYLLRTNDQRRRGTTIPKQANESCRTLQALHLFEICGTRNIDGAAGKFDWEVLSRCVAHQVGSNAPVHFAEITPPDIPFKGYQQEVRTDDELHHDGTLSIERPPSR